jgi:hypothetical protein
MLRLMISQSGLLSNGCRVAGVGRTNFHRALTGSVLLFLASLFLLSSFAGAQEVTGSIVGTVLDPNGAAVSGATVTAKDLDRGTVLTTTTNDDGAFNISGVPVGRYEVKVVAKGFQGAANPPLTLMLNQTARLNFRLRVGQATETIEVTAALPLMQTDSSLLGNVVPAALHPQHQPIDPDSCAGSDYTQPFWLSGGAKHLWDGTALRERSARAGEQFPARWHGQQPAR